LEQGKTDVPVPVHTRSSNAAVSSKQVVKHRGLSKEDLAMKERLERLKADRVTGVDTFVASTPFLH
jgi:hypothetical protein